MNLLTEWQRPTGRGDRSPSPHELARRRRGRFLRWSWCSTVWATRGVRDWAFADALSLRHGGPGASRPRTTFSVEVSEVVGIAVSETKDWAPSSHLATRPSPPRVRAGWLPSSAASRDGWAVKAGSLPVGTTTATPSKVLGRPIGSHRSIPDLARSTFSELGGAGVAGHHPPRSDRGSVSSTTVCPRRHASGWPQPEWRPRGRTGWSQESVDWRGSTHGRSS